MTSTLKVTNTTVFWPTIQPAKKQVQLKIDVELCAPEIIVEQISAMQGPVDIYFWYEGTKGVPREGAEFMQKQFFEPISLLKSDAKLCLYSLKDWDFKRKVSAMPSTPTVVKVNQKACEWFYAFDFFRYCKQVSQNSALYKFVSKELPTKKWLSQLSEKRAKSGMLVETFFDNQNSLFDCLNDKDCAQAYSSMQYMEAFYLIKQSINRALLKGQKKITIAFVLPNDEAKYYVDLPNEIQKLLQFEFGERLQNVEENILIRCFNYGDSIKARPYIEQPKGPFATPRDIIHNLNGGY